MPKSRSLTSEMVIFPPFTAMDLLWQPFCFMLCLIVWNAQRAIHRSQNTFSQLRTCKLWHTANTTHEQKWTQNAVCSPRNWDAINIQTFQNLANDMGLAPSRLIVFRLWHSIQWQFVAILNRVWQKRFSILQCLRCSFAIRKRAFPIGWKMPVSNKANRMRSLAHIFRTIPNAMPQAQFYAQFQLQPTESIFIHK